MAFLINKLVMINSCEIILEIFFSKNLCEIQVRTILECALYLIKYGMCLAFRATLLELGSVLHRKQL